MTGRQISPESPAPPALPQNADRGPGLTGRGRGRAVTFPYSRPDLPPTSHGVKTELAFLWERKWLPQGALALILYLWDDKATAPVCSHRMSLSLTLVELPTHVSGTDGRTERKEVELGPAAAARGGIPSPPPPQWSTVQLNHKGPLCHPKIRMHCLQIAKPWPSPVTTAKPPFFPVSWLGNLRDHWVSLEWSSIFREELNTPKYTCSVISITENALGVK